MSRLKTSLPETLATTVKATIADWQSRGKWSVCGNATPSLWTGSDEAKWLGWLDIVDEQIAQHDQLAKLAKEVQSRGFEHVLLLGMGGSSLCPEVLHMTFGRTPLFPHSARARFHRSGAGESVRAPDRHPEDALHCFEQVGQHARTEHLQAIFL